ncbi:MAG: hypothetical protein LC799_11795 [Actinobacteria bacterium]|nr:hypothetical protein [Actinomycetota bacterium]
MTGDKDMLASLAEVSLPLDPSPRLAPSYPSSSLRPPWPDPATMTLAELRALSAAVKQEADKICKAIQTLPPRVLNREAVVLGRCPKRDLLVRVFQIASGELIAFPRGRMWSAGHWWNPAPFWLPTNRVTGRELIMRCKCCADLRRVDIGQILAAVRAGRRAIILRSVRYDGRI